MLCEKHPAAQFLSKVNNNRGGKEGASEGVNFITKY